MEPTNGASVGKRKATVITIVCDDGKLKEKDNVVQACFPLYRTPDVNLVNKSYNLIKESY